MQKSADLLIRQTGAWLASFKITVYKFFNHSHGTNKFYKIFMLLLISFNFAAVIIGTFNIPAWGHLVLLIFEIFSVTVFIIEYAARMWIADMTYPDYSPAKARFKFITSFMGIVDFLAICPFFLPIFTADFRMLHMLRLSRTIRLMKLGRFQLGRTVKLVVKRKWRTLLAAVFADVIFISVITMIIYAIEHEAQPDVFRNALDSLRWTI